MLALIKNDTFIKQVPEGGNLNVAPGVCVSPAEAGWRHGDFRLVNIEPAAPIPAGFRAVSTSVMQIGAKWQFANDVTAITKAEIRAAMPDLERWRVNTVIDLTPALRGKIDAAIEAKQEPLRTISRNKLAHVSNFSRSDPLFDLIGGDPAIGLTPDVIDMMWLQGAAL